VHRMSGFRAFLLPREISFVPNFIKDQNWGLHFC